MSESKSDRVQFGPFEADLRTHELWKFGTRIRLVGQPFEVLAILLSTPGELVTREELRGRLWPGDTFVDFNHGLNAAVNRLRDALSDSADNPRYVETLPRRGYRFIGGVGRPQSTPAPESSKPKAQVTEPNAPSRHESVEISQSLLPERSKTESVLRATWVRRSYVLTLSILLILVLGALLVAKKISTDVDARSKESPMQRIRPLTKLADETSEPSFSPDGNYIAFRRDAVRPEDSGIFVKEIASDLLTQLTHGAYDCCPVWSPDGHSIAFSRFTSKEFGIYTVPFANGQARYRQASTGGNTSNVIERKLSTDGIVPRHGELSWSPDGKTIAFAGGTGIFLLSIRDSSVHRLTEPPPLAEDWGPSFSPDGESVLFVRSHENGFPVDILSIPPNGGEVTRISTDQPRVLGPPQWSSDSHSIIYASDQGSHPGLWRISLDHHEPPQQINDSGWYPSISRRGYRMAYQRIVRALNVWELDLSSEAKEQRILVPSTSETDQGPGPQFSRDGKKLAYMSDRSGTMEIWVSDRDGGNAYQLTAMGAAGTPRWSPDGQSIAFDTPSREGMAIFSISLQGGGPRLLVPGADGGGVCPSWSQDGKWIYYASPKSGRYEVWKVAAQGGTAVQVTFQGGHAPFESLDGRYVYYAKTHYANPEIWQIPVEGGQEKIVSPLVRPTSWASWALVDNGILFAGSSGNGKPVLSLYELSTHRIRNVGVLNLPPFWLGATRDGKTAVFDQPGQQEAQIMLVENFR
jgi:Tol biopolymer transport system component/DNA-binding winged helix-turn-helix (wHTH) protein